MPEAKEGDSVKVQYVGKLEDGSIFDSSAPDAPLEFTIGGNQVCLLYTSPSPRDS